MNAFGRRNGAAGHACLKNKFATIHVDSSLTAPPPGLGILGGEKRRAQDARR